MINMEFFIFTVGFLNFLVLGARGILIASYLRRPINHSGSSLKLYYLIQNQALSNSNSLLSVKSPEAEKLLEQCKFNIRLMFGIGFVCIVAIFPFA